jgi:hypothetical protein
LNSRKSIPLNGKDGAKPMRFPDASGVKGNILPVSDGRAFDQLKLQVNSEGATSPTPIGSGMLAAIGIVKGQPATPDVHSKETLDRAAKTAHKTSRVIGFKEIVIGSPCSSIQTAAGSTPWPAGHLRIRVGRST